MPALWRGLMLLLVWLAAIHPGYALPSQRSSRVPSRSREILAKPASAGTTFRSIDAPVQALAFDDEGESLDLRSSLQGHGYSAVRGSVNTCILLCIFLMLLASHRRPFCKH